jgi:hypothetical protein
MPIATRFVRATQYVAQGQWMTLLSIVSN